MKVCIDRVFLDDDLLCRYPGTICDLQEIHPVDKLRHIEIQGGSLVVVQPVNGLAGHIGDRHIRVGQIRGAAGNADTAIGDCGIDLCSKRA